MVGSWNFDGILRLMTGAILLPLAISLAIGFVMGLPTTATRGYGSLSPQESDLVFLLLVVAMAAFGAWEFWAGVKGARRNAHKTRT